MFNSYDQWFEPINLRTDSHCTIIAVVVWALGECEKPHYWDPTSRCWQVLLVVQEEKEKEEAEERQAQCHWNRLAASSLACLLPQRLPL